MGGEDHPQAGVAGDAAHRDPRAGIPGLTRHGRAQAEAPLRIPQEEPPVALGRIGVLIGHGVSFETPRWKWAAGRATSEGRSNTNVPSRAVHPRAARFFQAAMAPGFDEGGAPVTVLAASQASTAES